MEELRRLLVEKRRGTHSARLEEFRRTGRAASPPLHQAAATEHSAFLAQTRGASASGPRTSSHHGPPRLVDRALLGIEILAVVALVAVLGSGLGLLQQLNSEVAAALRPATPSVTPLVVAVVLPSGHLPPDAQGNTRPNEAEIPEHLRPVFQSLASIPVPTAAPGQAVRIQIPAINVDAPVVQGDGWEQLKKGVAQHVGSPPPGQSGNVVLSAHNDVYGELFRHLDRLAAGDSVMLYSQQRQYTYIVDRIAVVEPTAVDVMASTGSPTLTLISCYPYLVDTQRIVVFARLQG